MSVTLVRGTSEGVDISRHVPEVNIAWSTISGSRIDTGIGSLSLTDEEPEFRYLRRMYQELSASTGPEHAPWQWIPFWEYQTETREEVLMPPVRSQRVKLRVRNMRNGEPLRDEDE
jgi:hypothetical protein